VTIELPRNPVARAVSADGVASRVINPRAAALIVGVAAACALRVALGGTTPADSYPAAVIFAGALIALSVGAGCRVSNDARWRRSIGIGLSGAVVLVAAWITATPHIPLAAGQHLGPLLVWTPVVALVAVAEEIALRGVLFGALLEAGGAPLTVTLTSIVFGVMHVPLYGWGALPLDIAAGVLLGGLRLLSGGVIAPAVAHVVADLAGGWLG